MATQRAVLMGYIGGVVQIRSMFTCDVVPSGGDTAQVLWSAYMTSFYNELRQLIHGSVTFDAYELQNYSLGSWVPFDLIAFSHAGLGGGEALPNAVSVVLLGKGSGLRKVGRKFLGAIGETFVNANVLTSAGVAQALLILAAYITPFTGIGGGVITPGIVDKVGTFHPFVGGVVSSILGSMRRRKPGVGI
jgi:hypothetical protein